MRVFESFPNCGAVFVLEHKSGGPAIPKAANLICHMTCIFTGEANLYVDVDSYADIWAVPGNAAMDMRFHDSFIPSPLKTAGERLAKLRTKQNLELYHAEPLQIFNEAMKGLRVDEKTTRTELLAAYARAGENLQLALSVLSSDFTASELHN